MPSSKQGGGYTLSFARKNKDVQEILSDKKQKGIIITDYICDAVRFFEENKNKVGNNNIDKNLIAEIVEEKIKDILPTLIKSTEEVITKEYSLEDNLEGISIEDD